MLNIDYGFGTEISLLGEPILFLIVPYQFSRAKVDLACMFHTDHHPRVITRSSHRSLARHFHNVGPPSSQSSLQLAATELPTSEGNHNNFHQIHSLTANTATMLKSKLDFKKLWILGSCVDTWYMNGVIHVCSWIVFWSIHVCRWRVMNVEIHLLGLVYVTRSL